MDTKRVAYNKNKRAIQKAVEDMDRSAGEYPRLRKLMPRESLRLMGIDDEDIDKMLASGVPEDQLYKQAGNSIIVDVLYHQYRRMFIDRKVLDSGHQTDLIEEWPKVADITVPEKKKLKVFTCFSGYDSQCLALKRLAQNHPDLFDYELVGWSEIDEPAIQVHNALFPEASDKNLGDISKIDWHNDFKGEIELLTYSSPCQDFSIAGIMKGGVEGSGTRSALLWEVKRCIMEKRPEYLQLENVKNLYSAEKFRKLLFKWRDTVDSFGYKSWIKVLSGADYDVPQMRERVFMISIRKDVLERDFGKFPFKFPAPMERVRTIEDFLISPDKCPEEYYLHPKKVDKFITLLENSGDGYEELTTEEERNAIESISRKNMAEEVAFDCGLADYKKRFKENALF